MKKINHFLDKVGFWKFILLLFLFGFFIGAIGAVISKNYFHSEVESFFEQVVYNLRMCQMEYGQFLIEVLIKEFSSYFLLLLFCISILGIPYIIWYLIYKGALWGFFAGNAILQFGAKGIVVGLLYGFPHWLLLIPVIAATLHKGYYISINGPKKKAFTEQIPSILILMVILLLGCLLEAFVNARILKYILLWCSAE